MTKFTLMAVVALLVVGFAIVQVGAYWTDVTQVKENSFTSGSLVMDVSKTAEGAGSEEISAVWASPANWEPGDDPVEGKVYFKNSGTADVNILWSGFNLTGSEVLADNICVMAISDSTGTTEVIKDFGAARKSGNTGCVTLKEIATYLGSGGYFSNGGSTSAIYVAHGTTGWLSMKLGFKSEAPNSTMNQQAGFNWTLTAQQVPVHSDIQ